MREYDLAFSMGFGCGCSKSLRAAKLQFASYPMDWIGSVGLTQSVQTLVTDFAGWFDASDLELFEVHRERDSIHRIYVNRKTGFVFGHDFTSAHPFAESHAAAVGRYARRIERLMAEIRGSRRVLVAFVERPSRPRIGNEELLAARAALVAKFPSVQFDIAYFYHRDNCAAPMPETVADGVEAIACSYRIIECGMVSHAIRNDQITQYLAANMRARDRRTETERDQFAQEKRTKAEQDRYGAGGALAQWWNRLQFRWCRRLEEDLKEKGLLPPERSPVA